MDFSFVKWINESYPRLDDGSRVYVWILSCCCGGFMGSKSCLIYLLSVCPWSVKWYW
ncbi:hypothetical protein BDQ94DRAFT_142675 [Aspergillus welwitschiae]|uniref:Uncharacterized protein n=1 Tax=Aspergillus welwitschiae TaxID=1341132 RepID=A0A3F3Q3M9_9EURO|nr:hypothetical protein BDQ94DRAFT_142675 [Aspergillus welwitschiae]RDH33790.1 hypothetical protein BDQ94DRAFT_142675 [Aspergillus welwitschiae]